MFARLQLLFLILLLTAPAARSQPLEYEGSSGGGWSGNGGGLYQVSDNVWFLGPDPIRYCLRIGTDFPVAGDAARAMVARSFEAWRQFFIRYRIGRGIGVPSVLQAWHPQMSLSSQLGNCDDSTELEIDLGVDNEDLKAFRAAHESEDYGLAMRRAYDHTRHRASGYVWIPAFTKDPKKIEHMLLHELGHVFGMKHDTVFVMDRDVAFFLRDLGTQSPATLGSIEADFWPFDLSPGSKMNLTSYGFTSTCAKGGPSLSALPPEFFPQIMPLYPCVQLFLQSNGDGFANNFQLNITDESGQWLGTIYGNFQALEPGNEVPTVPGTLSTFLNASRKPINWVYVPYAKRTMHAQLSGYFIRGQIRYPAKISWNRGVVLEIFIPAQARWWTIRSFTRS